MNNSTVNHHNPLRLAQALFIEPYLDGLEHVVAALSMKELHKTNYISQNTFTMLNHKPLAKRVVHLIAGVFLLMPLVNTIITVVVLIFNEKQRSFKSRTTHLFEDPKEKSIPLKTPTVESSKNEGPKKKEGSTGRSTAFDTEHFEIIECGAAGNCLFLSILKGLELYHPEHPLAKLTADELRSQTAEVMKEFLAMGDEFEKSIATGIDKETIEEEKKPIEQRMSYKNIRRKIISDIAKEKELSYSFVEDLSEFRAKIAMTLLDEFSENFTIDLLNKKILGANEEKKFSDKKLQENILKQTKKFQDRIDEAKLQISGLGQRATKRFLLEGKIDVWNELIEEIKLSEKKKCEDSLKHINTTLEKDSVELESVKKDLYGKAKKFTPEIYLEKFKTDKNYYGNETHVFALNFLLGLPVEIYEDNNEKAPRAVYNNNLSPVNQELNTVSSKVKHPIKVFRSGRIHYRSVFRIKEPVVPSITEEKNKTDFKKGLEKEVQTRTQNNTLPKPESPKKKPEEGKVKSELYKDEPELSKV